MILRLVGDAERLKSGLFTVSVSVVVWLRLPEAPVIVTVAAPVVAVLLTVSVKALVAVAGFGLNVAVTPLGSPAADKFTLPVKPFCGATMMVLVPFDP